MSQFTTYKPSLRRTSERSSNSDKGTIGNIFDGSDRVRSYKGSPDRKSRKKRVFEPSKYETSSTGNFFRNTPRAVLKGDSGLDAESEIKSILADLRPYVSTKIDALPKEAGEKLGRLTTYVSLLYNTADYKRFYSWVVERYGDLREVIPATVGAYIIGCSIPTSFSSAAPGCAIACAGSIPRPSDDPTFRHCENTVILGEFNGQEYRFTVSRKADNPEYHENAYLYINNTDPVIYPGFSDDEKRDLKVIGVKQVKLFGYHSDGRNYVELTNDLVPIDNLRSRNMNMNTNMINNSNNFVNNPVVAPRVNDLSHPVNEPVVANSSGSNAIWIIVVIIVIIIIIIIVWYAVSRYRQPMLYQPAVNPYAMSGYY